MSLIEVVIIGTAPMEDPEDLTGNHNSPMSSYRVPNSHLQSINWIQLPLTSDLRVPLKITRLDGNAHINYAVGAFCMSHDNKHGPFGDMMRLTPEMGASQFYCADFMVARVDGKDLKRDLIQFMALYIMEAFEGVEFVSYKTSSAEQQGKMVATMSKIISKDAFAYHFQEKRRQELAAGNKGWEEEMGVEKGKLVCATCCVLGGEEKTLMICSMCKARHYCSKECQQGDWKGHKKVCAGREKVKAKAKAKAEAKTGPAEAGA